MFIEFTGFGLDSNLLPTFLNLSKSRYGKNFSSVENAAFRQGTMYHMHRVHMVHMVHVMDVVLHIDRHRSRHGNFHRNLYNMRYDRHILFLAATISNSSQDEFHFLVHLCIFLFIAASSWHARLAWTQHHSCFSRDHCECHWLKP